MHLSFMKILFAGKSVLPCAVRYRVSAWGSPGRSGMLQAVALGVVLWAVLGVCRAGENTGGLLEKEDGGAAVYTEGAAVVPKDELVSGELIAAFPVAQKASIHVLGGGVRGFGMLASYSKESPKSILVTRVTRPSSKEPYRPISLARVFDPQGRLAAIEDFTDQTTAKVTREIKIPSGTPGIWRVSFSGGRKDDLVEIRMPATPVWGVCGELSLGVTATTPRPAYIWLPPSSLKLVVGIEDGTPQGIEIRDESGEKILASPQPDDLKRKARLVLDPAPAGQICKLVLPEKFDGALVIDGAPGLLCPSPAAAAELRGGTVESHGLIVAGPLQARARNWMVAHAGVNRTPALAFPPELPGDLEMPQLQVLGFEKYGCLNSLAAMVERQNANLDPGSPYFGSGSDASRSEAATWVNFLPGRLRSAFFPGGLAAAATFDSPLNPVLRDPDFVTRTALAGLQEIAAIGEDFLLREKSLFEVRYPMGNAFGLYVGGITGPFREIRSLLPEDAREIWQEGVCAIGDKLADYQSYMSNQWAHILKGHLDIYIATHEKRFLGYFERLAPVFLQNRYGPASKFGLHPAGFYLEEYGPDGNYDNINSFFVAACYLDYKSLPEAKPELVEIFRQTIASNLEFRSLFWLPQPNGAIYSPTAFNCRTTANLAGVGYPGTFMVKGEFPLAAMRFAMTPVPEKGVGGAATFSYVANTPAWIRRVLKDGLRRGPDAFGGESSSSGWWVPDLVRAYAEPEKAEVAKLPFQEQDRTWMKPGLVAWKRGEIYGAVFYDVDGATRMLKGFFGGGPTVLWTSALGSFINSSSPYAATAPAEGKSGSSIKRIFSNSASTLDAPEKITFSCLYGRDGQGRFFFTGKERSSLQEDNGYKISSTLENPKASLLWSYQAGVDEVVMGVTFRPAAPVKEVFLNLPLWIKGGNLQVEKADDHTIKIANATGAVQITWSPGVAGAIAPSTIDGLQRLVIGVPQDGTSLQVTFRTSTETRAAAPVSPASDAPAGEVDQ